MLQPVLSDLIVWSSSWLGHSHLHGSLCWHRVACLVYDSKVKLL